MKKKIADVIDEYWDKKTLSFQEQLDFLEKMGIDVPKPIISNPFILTAPKTGRKKKKMATKKTSKKAPVKKTAKKATKKATKKKVTTKKSVKKAPPMVSAVTSFFDDESDIEETNDAFSIGSEI